MYLIRRKGFSALAGGVFAVGIAVGAAASQADPFFSYLESTDERPVSARLAAVDPLASVGASDVMAIPAAAPVAVGAPAIGTWTTVVRPTVILAQGPVAQSSRPAVAPAAHLIGPRLTGTGHSLSGVASYYWQEQKTATGEQFNRRDLTAAHRTLPFGTRVRVTRLDTGSSVIVRINDRGPFKEGRVIDLSERAAEDIGMTGRGLTEVRLEVLGK